MALKERIIDEALKVPGWMSRYDMEALYDLAIKVAKPGSRLIEIGCWKGLSTYLLGRICQEKKSTLIAIDTFAGDDNEDSSQNQDTPTGYYREAVVNPDFYKIFLKNIKGLPVITMKGDSQKLAEFLPDGQFDFCFLDGNHKSPTIDNDLALYIPKVKSGGIFCGHDYNNFLTDVNKAVEKAVGKDHKLFPTKENGEYTSIWYHNIK